MSIIKFYLDATLLGAKSAGIARDIQRIVHSYPDYTFQEFNNNKFSNQQVFLEKAFLGFQSLKGATPYRIDLGPQEMIFIPQLRGRYSMDKYKTVIRIHDLFPLQYPQFFPKLSSKLFVDALKATEKESKFLTNSFSTSKILQNLVGIKSKNIFLQHCLPPIPQERCGICLGAFSSFQTPYILAVGTIEPRKNYETLLRAFHIYKNKGGLLKLVIIGNRGWLSKKLVGEIKSAEEVIWLEHVCDCRVQKIMQGANAFISVSLDEGFNLPAAEARFFGRQILLSNIGIHRELHGETAIFFDLNPLNIARQMAIIPVNGPVILRPGSWIDPEISPGLQHIGEKFR